jgi:adenylate cyclase class 2
VTTRNEEAPLETEIKIEVSDVDAIRARLSELGATFLNVVDEDNLYFKRRGKPPKRRESLRLRHDGRFRLTWKGPTRIDRHVTARPEIEIEVSDFNLTKELLTRLGFEQEDRLAKHRETWQLSGVQVMVDTLDFGTFVEIEGPPDLIRDVSAQLNLDLAAGLHQSYRQLRQERSGADVLLGRQEPRLD